jgi:hypothetical protein
MKFGKYTDRMQFDEVGRTRSGYEAWDGDKLKGVVETRDAFWSNNTQYPSHPSTRPSREAAFGPGPHATRSSESLGMNGARGPLADGDYRMQSYDKDWAEHNATATGQIPMFLNRSKYNPPELEYMRTTKGARAVAGPLIGIAALDHMERGHALTPSSDLSEHSARVVDKLNKNLGTQFQHDVTNDLDFIPDGTMGSRTVGTPRAEMEGIDEMPQAEVDRGRKFMRRALRRAPAVPDRGYEQMGLFDA